MRKLLPLLFLFLFSARAFAITATPTAISTMTFAAGVLTVNSTAHGLAANNGFCILGSSVAADNFCGTVLAVTNANTFTTKLSTGVACAATCGTVQPAKLFLIAGDPFQPAQGQINVTYCIWNTTATPLPVANGTSGCANGETNATLLNEENSAIAAGTLIETHETRNFPGNWDITKVFNFLLDLQLSKQIAIAAAAQPGRDTGRFCDTVGCN
jgi:hypothetical protein